MSKRAKLRIPFEPSHGRRAPMRRYGRLADRGAQCTLCREFRALTRRIGDNIDAQSRIERGFSRAHWSADPM
jgi:hypothetical protein